MTDSMIANRLKKNWGKLKGWADKENIQAWRLYFKDIPEFPFIIDVYQDYFVIGDKSIPDSERDQLHLKETQAAIQEHFQQDSNKIIIKQRRPQKRDEKYGTQSDDSVVLTVTEGKLKFEVNLTKYIDTGLFIDHRPLRKWLVKNANNKHVLNLFAYTGSLSVASAAGGASVTHVDLSRRYVDWAKKNFTLNDIDPTLHRFIDEDVVSFLKKPSQQKYDWILLDPPTFSNSKSMDGDFDLQRDHEDLITHCRQRLLPSGTIFFSGNRKSFKLAKSVQDQFRIIDRTEQAIPKDFQGKKSQFFFELSLRNP